MVLRIFTFDVLRFSELSLLGLALDVVDKPLSFSAMMLLVEYNIVDVMTCNVSSVTLNYTVVLQPMCIG